MTTDDRMALRIVGTAMVLGAAAVTFGLAPPAIQMHGSDFFWWGFVPGAVFAAGLLAAFL